jgi:ABC-type molybdenum transport system ATPase subunit/photorepair protein PhrA
MYIGNRIVIKQIPNNQNLVDFTSLCTPPFMTVRVFFIPAENRRPDMIQVEGPTKDYSARRALDSLTFTAEPGEIVGFLGPNGTGKTTVIPHPVRIYGTHHR